MALFNKNGLTLSQRLFGVQAPDVDTIDISGVDMNSPEFQENAPEMANIRIGNPVNIGGLLPDVAKGFQENYTTGFAANNLAPDQNKSVATRIGEGLGTAARFIDSPLGRGLIAGGLVGAIGGNPAQMLGYGLGAGVGRQNYQTADKLYRNQLKQYGYTDDDLNAIRGNITDDMYKNLSQNLYKTQKLSQDTYTKLKALYDRQLVTNNLSPEEYKLRIASLNNAYVNSNIQTAEAGNVGVSNQTRNTNINEKLAPAREQYYINAVNNPLGWANYGLKADKAQQEAEIQNKVIKALDDMGYNNNNPKPAPQKNTIKEGTIIKNKAGQRMIMKGGKWQTL